MKHYIDLARQFIQLDSISKDDKRWIYNILGALFALLSFGLLGCIYQPLFSVYLCIYLVCLVFTRVLEKIHILILSSCLLCLGVSGLLLYRQPIILFSSISSTLSMFISWLLQREVKEIEEDELKVVEDVTSRLQLQINQSNLLEEDKLQVEKEMQKLYADLQEQTMYITSLKELISEQQYTISILLTQKEEVIEQCRSLHKESYEQQSVISKLEDKLQCLCVEESNEILLDDLNKLRLEHFQYKLITNQLIDSNLEIDKIRAYMGNFIQIEEKLHTKLEDIHDLRLEKIYLESIITHMQSSHNQLLEENSTLEQLLNEYIHREDLYQSIDLENEALEKNIQSLLTKKKKNLTPVEVG